MDIYDLTVKQLRRAAAIKEQLARLNEQLGVILGPPTKSGTTPRGKRIMSAAVRRKIAATQRARWANLRRATSARRAAKPAPKAKKKVFSAATRAKLSARLKAYWAAKKAGKK
jgi:hypothetical protein